MINTTYNFDALRHKAWSKYQISKLNENVLVQKRAYKRWSSDILHIRCLETLVNWCDKRKITIEFSTSNTGLFLTDENKIIVNSRVSPESQVYCLLHECGHYLVGAKKIHERFGMGYSITDEKVKKTFHHRCDIIDEEYEAWSRGWNLSKRLAMLLDKQRFDKAKVRALRSYFKWALKINFSF